MTVKKKISVIIPCLNEEQVIASTHERLLSVLGFLPDQDLEVVYVDDGSTDATMTVIGEIVIKDARVKLVSLSRNFGHQAALSAGLLYATGDAVAIMDADLQDPPELLLTMIDRWREGYEVVYAIRARREAALWKRLAYRTFYRLYRAMADIEVPVDSGDFGLLDRHVVDAINALPEKNRFVRGLRSWVGFRQIGIEYHREARTLGDTKYSFSKLFRLARDGIFNFTTAPLTWIFILGTGISCLSFLIGVFYFFARIFSFSFFGYRVSDVPGFASIILVILFFGGVQLAAIGVLGIYLARIYEEVKSRPSFIVKDVKGAADLRR